MTWSKVSFCFTVLGVLFVGQTSQGALTSYEGFDYPSSSDYLIRQPGGTGFSTAFWQFGGFNVSVGDNFKIGPGSLSYPSLTTSGNRVTTVATSVIAGVTRSFSHPISASQTITQYYSFLIRPEGNLNEGAWNGFFGLYLDGSLGNDLFIGKSGGGVMDKYVLEDRGGANQIASSQSVVLQQTTLLILKAEYKPGADKFTLFTNTTGTEPPTGTVKTMDLGDVSTVVIYSTGAFSLDELRVGDTFRDVVPVPEPMSISLLGSGLLGILAFLWRRRS